MAEGLVIGMRFIHVIPDHHAVAREGPPDVTQTWRWAFQNALAAEALTGDGIIR